MGRYRYVVAMLMTVLWGGWMGKARAEKAPPSAAGASPYSLPWQLRPVSAATVVRSDTTFALYNDADGGASTVASMLLASYRVVPDLAVLVRVGYVGNTPAIASPGQTFVNPALGVTYGLKLSPHTRLGLFLGATLPVGMGGGNSPPANQAAANRAGILARSAMDNAMFAVNDFTVFPGVDFAYVRGGLTLQAEVTLLQLTRVRGEASQPDASKTNFTSGVHVGYFLLPQLSVGAEWRYQRWLSTPAAVAGNALLRDNMTAAAGVRGHWKVGNSIWARPGISYALGLDRPMSDARYHIVQLDLPVSF